MNGMLFSDLLVLGLLLMGALLMVIAAIGLLRMPDLYLRTSVSSKGATLGVAAFMLAAALHFGNLGVSSRALAIIVFMLVTAPVAAHMVGRAAYRSGVPFVDSTQQDDLTKKAFTMAHLSSEKAAKGGQIWTPESAIDAQ